MGEDLKWIQDEWALAVNKICCMGDERVSFLTPLPPLRESFAQFLEQQKGRAKYHRKTNYKPKYTL